MASKTSTNVWERRRGEAETISRSAFWGTVALWSTVGILTAAGTAYEAREMAFSWGSFIGLFLVALLGIFGVNAAANANSFTLATLCYFFIAAPMGALLGPVVALYTAASVFKVFAVTSLLTIGLGLYGMLLPKSLDSWGPWLFGALWLLIISQFLGIFAAAFGFPPTTATLHLFDWIGVIIFSAFIIFDFNRAARVTPTHTNALLVAVEIFLDFINLFIRLLELFGKARD